MRRRFRAGEWITASGEWTNDRTHGLQFRARFLKASAPSSVEGIEKYLGSGMIRGIGPVYATRMVRLFGTDVFDIIEASPARLREVEGIGPKRADRITAAWADQKRIREIMVFLHQHGVGTARAVRIFKTYGADAVQVMSENPYRLARDIRGIGFRTADLIAETLGIEKTAMIRVRAGIAFALTEAMGDGHCGLPTAELNTLAVKLLDVPEDLIASALEMELAAQTVTADSVAGHAVRFSERALSCRTGGRWTPAPCDRRTLALAGNRCGQGAALGRGPHRPDPGRQSGRSRAPRVALEDDGDHRRSWCGQDHHRQDHSADPAGQGRDHSCCARPRAGAAKRMSEATGMEAKTIHRLLEVDPKTFGFPPPRGQPAHVRPARGGRKLDGRCPA